MADLIKYLPDVYKEFYEYQEMFNAENPEFDLLDSRIKTLENNLFPQSADKSGLSRFEELLGIVPLPTDTLEQRRANVISKLNYRLPYTEIQLRKILAALFGWENYRVSTKDLEAVLSIFEDNRDTIRTTYRFFWDIIPMNMKVQLRQFFQDKLGVKAAASKTFGLTLKINPRSEE